ncbi:MAG: phosphate signaling complex protein PhoU [Armatimonadota bacterium]
MMVEAARVAFADEINELEQDVLKMGSVVEQMLHKAIEALAERNPSLADEAISMDDIVDDYNLAIEERCLRLLALQQPMARDLRHIAATMKIITDIERMGDYVVDIAKTAKELSERPLFKRLVNIPKMADLVKSMLHEVLEAFVKRDLQLIQTMIEHDDIVDNIDKSLHVELLDMMRKDPSIIQQAIPLLLVSRYLERFADHVTNVGERVYYMETGEMKELHM